MGKHSRDKGKRGEREWCDFLRRHGYEANRTAQNRGTPDSPDVESNCPIPKWEVKRGELSKGLFRIVEEAGEVGALGVAWRRDREDWLMIFDAEKFMDWMKGEGRTCLD